MPLAIAFFSVRNGNRCVAVIIAINLPFEAKRDEGGRLDEKVLGRNLIGSRQSDRRYAEQNEDRAFHNTKRYDISIRGVIL